MMPNLLRQAFSGKPFDLIVRVGVVVGSIAGLLAFHVTYIRPFYRVNLSGLWEVTHQIKTSQRPSFVGLEIAFNFILTEDNSKIMGRGSKTKANGVIVQGKERPILELDGYSDGSTAFVFYRERAEGSSESVVHGVIMWNVSGPNALNGTFDSSVDGVTGTSNARRVGRIGPLASMIANSPPQSQ